MFEQNRLVVLYCSVITCHCGSNLRSSVAAQHRPAVDQHYRCAIPSSCQRGGSPCASAASNNDVYNKVFFYHASTFNDRGVAAHSLSVMDYNCWTAVPLNTPAPPPRILLLPSFYPPYSLYTAALPQTLSRGSSPGCR